MDWKRYRESVGYTQAKMSKDARAWYGLAMGYHRAAELLNEFADRIPRDTRPFAFNAALSLEQILKAILARKKAGIPTRGDGHDLLFMTQKAGLQISENQKKTLDLLTATIIWSGRYPAPNSESKWDEYQDFTFESHVVRTTVGNVSSVRANRDTFPDWNNYLKIWELCLLEYEGSAQRLAQASSGSALPGPSPNQEIRPSTILKR
jgi:HEPN domain-containing protein